MYELLDFGDGRKLERFGQSVVDRPCPAANEYRQRCPDSWKEADFRYERNTERDGEWNPGATTKPWIVDVDSLKFSLHGTPQGQVGLFPEQIPQWTWLRRIASTQPRPSRVLNLFAYTGGTTLTLAQAGAEVTHVDASRVAVRWARENAALSRLSDAPIRWIVDDARDFVRRELKRGRSYDGVILDPPSYGHGVHGREWKIERDLAELLNLCAQLASRPRLVLLSCHTPGFTGRLLAELMGETWNTIATRGIESGDLRLVTAAGRELPSGVFSRWAAGSDAAPE